MREDFKRMVEEINAKNEALDKRARQMEELISEYSKALPSEYLLYPSRGSLDIVTIHLRFRNLLSEHKCEVRVYDDWELYKTHLGRIILNLVHAITDAWFKEHMESK